MADDRTQAQDPLIGAQLGAYRIETLIGIGGMGRVYKAVQPAIGSRVAIKVLSRECTDRKDLVERFFAEARAINVVAHESIVNVLDLSELPDGRPYIVMEFLDGAPLSNVIETAKASGTPLPIGTVTRLATEVLDALGAAHGKGVIHRDLKPDNIFVTPAGRAKVLDFGIAKLQPELGGKNTHTGSLLGTPPYMSPEQAAGRAIDTRADLYAMGIILFECLTLQRPFVADALFDLLKKHIEEPPPSPRSIRSDIPLELEQVILTALAKFPAQRFANARAMSAALQHATQNLPPEQWAPLAVASQHGSGSLTPRASWSNSDRGEMAMAATQAPSEAPGGTLTHTPSKPPTQTSGQTSSPQTLSPQRNLGPWIALSSLIAVAGVIVGIVLLTGKDKAEKSVAQENPSVPGPAPITAPEPPEPPVVVVEKSDSPAPTKKHGSDEDADDDDGEDVDDQIDQALALAGQDMPPEAKAALKKYGSWAKVPKSERKKLGMQIASAMTAQTAQILDNVGKNLQKSGADMKADALDKPVDIELPASWQDADATITFGFKIALKTRPDAKLTRIDLDGLYADGHVDKEIKLRFVEAGKPCGMWLDFEADGAKIRPMPDSCKDDVAGKPHCTVKQMLKKYSALHPTDSGPFSVYFGINKAKHSTRWMIASEVLPDDC
ncbi:MAG: serine/threonine-protein kinase [Kofleriaceae bacterium]